MVRKSGKKGVRTGNTLRASNSRYTRTYHAESCIVRKSCNLSRRQTNCEADDNLLDVDGVVYSLNKKGRWVLPTLIKNHIIEEDSDVTISMYKRHKVTRQSNCFAFYCNNGKVKSIVSEHGYFNAASVQRIASAETEGEDGSKPDPDPEIRYDVFYPSPITSSISHNRKYIRSADVVTLPNGVVRDVGRCRRKGGNRRRVRVNCDENISDFEESESFDDRQSENDDEPQNDDFTEVHSPEVMLIDILETADRVKKLCVDKSKRGKVKVKKIRSSGDAWVFVNRKIEADNDYSRVPNDDIDTVRTSELPPTPKLESVRILLQSENTRQEHLQEIFQNRYTECRCSPRKFIIDTTQEVQEAMKQCKFSNSVFLASLDLSSCVVFSRQADYDVGVDVYGVQLNIGSALELIRLETLFDLMRTNVEEVVQAASVFVTTLPQDSFQTKETLCSARASEKLMTFQMTSTINKWNTESIHLHDAKPCSEHGLEVVSEASGAATENKEQLEYCNICFDTINPELMDSSSSTALLSCGHWFCDGCWGEHISERIYSGAVSVKCPEYGCDSVLDTATILSLVNIKHAQLLQRQSQCLVVEKSTNLKWCPNPRCGRVLKTKTTDGECVTVSCECGRVVCFRCLGDAHWPASCTQATDYVDKVQRGNDETLLVDREKPCKVIVRGKFCPNCKRHIEKKHGCKMMVCICNYAFCWTCLGEWETHAYKSTCMSKNDYFGTHATTIYPVSKPDKPIRKTNMYKLAVDNRAQRKPMLMRALQSKVNFLTAQLNSLLAKGVDIGGGGLSAGCPVTSAQLHDFLMQMMQLKLELNHVIEHTAVLLDGRMIRSGSRKMAHICERLGDICSAIDADLSRKGRPEVVGALPSLCHLRSLARRGVIALVSQLTTIGTSA